MLIDLKYLHQASFSNLYLGAPSLYLTIEFALISLVYHVKTFIPVSVETMWGIFCCWEVKIRQCFFLRGGGVDRTPCRYWINELNNDAIYVCP